MDIKRIIDYYYSLPLSGRFTVLTEDNYKLSKKLEKDKKLTELSLNYEMKHLSLGTGECKFKKEIYKKKVIGSGFSGTVYLLEDGDVLKVIPLNKRYKTESGISEKIKNELKITKLAGELGIGPKMKDGFVCCDKSGKCYYGLKTEFIDGISLCKYIATNKLSIDYKDNKKKIMTILNKKIKLMYKNNIIHGDFHDDNILVLSHPKSKEIVDVFIIDFGKSFIFNSKESKNNLIKKDKDKLESYILLIEKGLVKTQSFYVFVADKLISSRRR